MPAAIAKAGGIAKAGAGQNTPLDKSHTGGLKSKRAKVGGICSQLMSQWKTSGSTHEIQVGLAKCRAQARAHGQANLHEAAGNQAKADVLRHRANTGKVGVANRLAQAKTLRAAHAAKTAPAPATTAKPAAHAATPVAKTAPAPTLHQKAVAARAKAPASTTTAPADDLRSRMLAKRAAYDAKQSAYEARKAAPPSEARAAAMAKQTASIATPKPAAAPTIAERVAAARAAHDARVKADVAAAKAIPAHVPAHTPPVAPRPSLHEQTAAHRAAKGLTRSDREANAYTLKQKHRAVVAARKLDENLAEYARDPFKGKVRVSPKLGSLTDAETRLSEARKRLIKEYRAAKKTPMVPVHAGQHNPTVSMPGPKPAATPVAPKPAPSPPPSPAAIHAAHEQHAASITARAKVLAEGGSGRVWISDLRVAHQHLSREQFDAALKQSITKGHIAAYGMDDPSQFGVRGGVKDAARAASDKAAAFRTPSGNDRFVVYPTGRGSNTAAAPVVTPKSKAPAHEKLVRAEAKARSLMHRAKPDVTIKTSHGTTDAKTVAFKRWQKLHDRRLGNTLSDARGTFTRAGGGGFYTGD